MYQKCPICDGSGKIPNCWNGYSSAHSEYKTCPTCLGERIISKTNGLPPSSQKFFDITYNEKICEMNNFEFSGILNE